MTTIDIRFDQEISAECRRYARSRYLTGSKEAKALIAAADRIDRLSGIVISLEKYLDAEFDPKDIHIPD